jgi:protein TonB
MGRVLGCLAAVLLHGAVLIFGGLLFLTCSEDELVLQDVELLTEADAPEEEDEKKEDEPAPDTQQDLAAEAEEVPDAAEIIRNLELSAAAAAPALDAASLGSIEAALSGAGGGGDFADALSFASGGRIGGMGKAGALDDQLESAFSLAEIDQKPRAVFQASPLYPSDMRGKKIEGVVTVIFVVDSTGRVTSPRVEKSTHPSFEKPALDAVKQWKFEPAVKGGKRVGCKMRVPIRFQPS